MESCQHCGMIYRLHLHTKQLIAGGFGLITRVRALAPLLAELRPWAESAAICESVVVIGLRLSSTKAFFDSKYKGIDAIACVSTCCMCGLYACLFIRSLINYTSTLQLGLMD
jgi:hypothetical protein